MLTAVEPQTLVGERADVEREPLQSSGSTTVRLWNVTVMVAAVGLFTVLAWRRRWMSDDGLIVLRTVRQILAGNGPVFNAGERVEVNTSTLWTALLALTGWIPGIRLEWLAVLLGLTFAAGGLLLALDGARRIAAGSASDFVVPAGALVVAALPPFRDFATSGLETGLISAWLGGSWWLLVRIATGRRFGPDWTTVLVIGLGPLVRPDLALFSLVAGVGLMVLRRPGWRRALAWACVAAAIPLAYQVFRMGYYGLLTPNTAIAKEAADARWDRGIVYLMDLAAPYQLWLPLLGCAVAAGLLVRRGPVRRQTAVVVAIPLIAAAALALYVVRVGGDFMHGRMLLPALFCLLMPVMAIRLTRWTALPLMTVGIWAIVAAGWLRPPYSDQPQPIDQTTGIADERGVYTLVTDNPNPIVAEDFGRFRTMSDWLALQLEPEPEPVVLLWNPELSRWSAYPSANGRDLVMVSNLGGIGMMMPLEVWVHDTLGLANPIASHTRPQPEGRTGHDKFAGSDWDIVEFTGLDPATLAARRDIPAARLDAIRRTLDCPGIRRMLDSVHTPLTPARFGHNVLHATTHSRLRYDHDPFLAQHCR